MAKHRFASVTKPRGRGLLFLEAVLSTGAWLAVHRRHKEEGRTATTWLQALSEEMLLLAALAADGADEAMGLLRHFDSEDVDTAQTTFQATAFMSRFHYLFTEAGVGSSGA